MRLTEKYIPKTRSEFVGNKVVIEEAEKFLFGVGLTRDEENKYRGMLPIPVLLIGKQGIGKTSIAHIFSNEYKHELDISNSSADRNMDDLRNLDNKLRSKGLVKKIFLVDEVDGIENSRFKCQDYLAEIISTSKHPVILTANDKYQVSLTLKKVSHVIEMYPPKLYDVVSRIEEIARREGVSVTYEKVTDDVRSSINAVFHNGEKYERKLSNYVKVERILKMKDPHDIDIIWLIDNLHNFYFGLDIYEAIKIIKLYYVTKRKEILKYIPISYVGKSEKPYYFKKVRKNGYSE